MALFTSIAKYNIGVVIAISTLFFFSAVQSVTLIPKPTGRYEVSITTMKLIDKARLDPYAPDRRHRAVMLSLFHPVKPGSSPCQSTIAYMPPATAALVDRQLGFPNHTFEKLAMQVCSSSKHHHHHNRLLRNLPVVLFSHGFNTSRLFYNAIVQSVASSGYVVASIDHPYDANVVEFPDGECVFSRPITTLAEWEFAVATRTQDASFVLDRLGAHGLDVRRVAMFGHSLGGATAASTMLNDGRVVGGLNMDGWLFGPVVTRGLDDCQPFMIVGAEGHNRSVDQTWAATWPRLRGWKLEVGVAKSQHYTFSDMPLLAKIVGVRSSGSQAFELQYGTLDGSRARELVRAYVTAFLDFVLHGANPMLLQKPDPRFPEVSFVYGKSENGRRRFPSA